MANKYVVANKWTTSDPNSPGYMSGFEVDGLLFELDQRSVGEVLQSRGIDSAYFDLTIYQNYANASIALRGAGEIQFFAKAKLDASLCFSLLVYANKEDDIFLDSDNLETVQNMNVAKAAYMQLINLVGETRRGYTDIEDDILASMYENQTLTLEQAQSIFNSIL
jgi:hypothetical protein